MILSRAILRHLLLPGAAFVASLIGTIAVRSQQPAAPVGGASATARWLELSEQQSREVLAGDPDFAIELGTLRGSLEEARRLLAESLEGQGVTDGDIRTRFEAVIAAHNALERRVMNHLLAVRAHLTPDQQNKLLQLCAEGVREQGGNRWRHGRGGGGEAGGGASHETGGRGRGRGKGGGH